MSRFGFILALVLTGAPMAWGQWRSSLTYQMEPGLQTDEDEAYFEHFLDVQLGYGRWQLEARYEKFNPAKPQSIMDEAHGIWRKALTYQGDRTQVKIGSFYTLLGRGLVLKAYDYPSIGLDRRLEGVFVESDYRYFSVKALTGNIFGLDRETHNDITGGQVTFRPWSALGIGGTHVRTETRFGWDEHWSSVFTDVNLEFGTFFGEVAFSDDPDGSAKYFALNMFVDDASILLEVKDYDKFAKADGNVIYNDPPTLVQEHRFVLWNRHYYALDAYDEFGYSAKIDTPVGGRGLLTLHHNATQYHAGWDVFKETYGLLEWDFENGVEASGIAGIQEDMGWEYLNIGTELRFGLGERTLGMMLEAQVTDNLYQDQSFNSQALTVDFIINAKHVVSMIAEHSDSDESDRTSWLGFKYGLRLGRGLDLDVFAGSRRKGKICAGGICVYSPEFEGVELRARYRLDR